jgi:hypothetical protein
MQRGVICMLVARRGRRAIRQHQRIHLARRLQLTQPSRQRLRRNQVQHRRGRAALRYAGAHGHPRRNIAVVEDPGDGVLQQQAHPPADLGREAQAVNTAEQPATIEAIVRLLKV